MSPPHCFFKSSMDNKLSVHNSSTTLLQNQVSDLLMNANISSTDFEFLVPKPDDRADNPPPGYISVYKHQIQSGLRFPLHPLVLEISNRMDISPSQLTPDAHSVIVGFILCAKLYHIPVHAKCFFSLFKGVRYHGENLFRFCERLTEEQFLDVDGVLLHGTEWEREFFFLRPVGDSWNCITEWRSVRRLTPPVHTAVRSSLQELARGSGMLGPGFRVAGLVEKDLLVLGGIEQPGHEPPRFTFKYLMHRAAITKFVLHPEDIPLADATKKRPLSADACIPSTLTDRPVAPSASEGPIHCDTLLKPAEEADEALKGLLSQTRRVLQLDEDYDRAPAYKKANYPVHVSDEAQPRSLPGPDLLKILKVIPPANATKKRPLSADASDVPIHVTPSFSFNDKLPLKELFCDGGEDRAASHKKANHAVLESDEAQLESLPAPDLLAISKVQKKEDFSMDKLSVSNCSSTLVEDEVSDLLLRANISSTDYKFLVPSKDDRADNPPPGYISVYRQQIESGLRFPLHALVLEICNKMMVSPSQLTPEAHSAIVGFILCAKLYSVPIDAKCFFSLFKVARYHGERLFQFYERHTVMQFLLMDGVLLPDSEWERQFFFLRPVGKSWNCRTHWTDVLRLSPTIKATTRNSFQELARKSGMLEASFRVATLVEKDLLVHGGIEQPGHQPPQLTFKYLMHRAAITKFVLEPEDIPPANAANKAAKKRPLSADASVANTSTDRPVAPPASKGPIHNDTLLKPGKEADHDEELEGLLILTRRVLQREEHCDRAPAYKKANRPVRWHLDHI